MSRLAFITTIDHWPDWTFQCRAGRRSRPRMLLSGRAGLAGAVELGVGGLKGRVVDVGDLAEGGAVSQAFTSERGGDADEERLAALAMVWRRSSP